MFHKITVCLDMNGCPNRCKHCWISFSPNGNLKEEDLLFVADSFKKYTKHLNVYDWYREPDFHDDYQKRWQLAHQLSNDDYPHFQLASIYRLVKDEGYVKWLKQLQVDEVQITLFGNEEKTDYYTGRKGAFQDIIKAMDILLENGIAPRIQFFLNKDTVSQLPWMEKLIDQLELEKRCQQIGREFHFFTHLGSCDGENEKLYPIRSDLSDVAKIPDYLLQKTFAHFHTTSIEEIFGQPERYWCQQWINDDSTIDFTTQEPVFYVDCWFNVYPNITNTSKYFLLGNMKTESMDTILKRYRDNQSIGQKVAKSIPTKELVKQVGDPQSARLFDPESYRIYLINRYCQMNDISKEQE